MACYLPFGVLRRPHGTRGEILLAPFNVACGQRWQPVVPLAVRLVRGADVRESVLVASRSAHAGFLVRFHDQEARARVAALVGCEVHLPRSALAPLAEGEFYVEDMVGCEAFGLDGERLGHVAGTFWNGAQDVMTIVREDGSERLLPVVAHFISRFAPAERRVIVDLHD